jgi:general secretion pathway protein K
VIGLLAVMAMDVLFSARRETRQGEDRLERARMAAAAEAGLALAAQALLRGAPADAAGPHAFDGSLIAVEIEAESGKVDLNLARVELLRAVIEAVGESRAAAASLAAAIIDWRDNDDQPEPRGGIEAEGYRRLGRAVPPRDGELQSVSELADVYGMTPELLSRLTPVVTVHGRQAEPDPVVASPLVRRAMRGAAAAARQAGTLEAEPEAAPPPTPGRGPSLTGRAFTLRIEVVRPNGGWLRREAVIRLSGNRRDPLWVHEWR